jgi:predicted Zn finger-like uncharacterized protein
MPIPTTCPGCRAAFEVPDGLAGKTIRCTSCKTQLTVPAAPAAASALSGGKKPFGWSNGKAAEAAPVAAAEPVAAEVEEDEEAPAPVRKAKAVAVAKAVPAKRRRDDDDDEDDTPRRKKRDTGGAKGAMWLLIGGGALALAAVVGVSIWLLTGDKKKDDTAKNPDPAPAGEKTAPEPEGKPDPTRPNPGRPNPGAGGTWQTFTADGFSADMPGKPTRQTQPLPAGAGTLTVYALANPADKSALTVSVVALPPEAAAIPAGVMLDQFVRGAENGAGGAGGVGQANLGVGSKSDVTQDGFPGKELQLTNKTTRAAAGTMRVVLAGDRVFTFGAVAENFAAFRTQADRFLASAKVTYKPSGSPAPGLKLLALLGAAEKDDFGTPGEWAKHDGDGFAAEFPGAADARDLSAAGLTGKVAGVHRKDGESTVVLFAQYPSADEAGKEYQAAVSFFGRTAKSHKPIVMNGRPGSEFEIATGAGSGVVRTYVAKDRVFVLTVGSEAKDGQGPLPKESIDRFLKSVTITYGDPAKPPEPKADPSRPPVVTPPTPPVSPPTGGEIVAKLAHKVSPFMAGAFDPDKKEFVAVGTRTDKGGVTRGTIQRYSLPGFKSVKTVHIPAAATRAVLDPKKGLLYVATAPGSGVPAQAVDREKFDRGAHVGDVAVYDLAAVRAAEEKSDIKPVATVTVGRVIRDLALSDDGKSLYVLSTTATPPTAKQLPKARVDLVDTGEKKVSKTKDLPDPAWQMFRSADGKKLYVTGRPSGDAAPSLTVVDPATLALAPSVPLPRAGVYDAAPAKDGRIVLTVPGGGGAFGLEVVEPSGQTGPAVKATVNPASNNGYVGVTPDGKYLVVSSHHPMQAGPGVDVYEATDTSMGERKVASFKKAGADAVGGTFLVAPEGNVVVFHKGEVVNLDDLGSTPAGPGPGPVPPGGGIVPVPPGGGIVPVPPGGGIGQPGFPPMPVPPGGGVNPVPPGGGLPGVPPRPNPGQPGRPPVNPLPPGKIDVPPNGGVPPLRPPGVPGGRPPGPGGVVLPDGK